MWLKNTVTRNRPNRSATKKYLTLNLQKSNPAIRVSELTMQELGWEHDDFCDLYIDDEKIQLIKNNENEEFQIKANKLKDVNYGFSIYGHFIKEHLMKMGWAHRIMYPVEIAYDGNRNKMLICYKAKRSK
jgi:hypothetical protein